VAIGAVVGIAAGGWLGDSMVGLYGEYFDFPVLRYAMSWRLAAIAVGVSSFAAWTGAYAAVRRAVALPPAEAMRPEAPARYRPGWVERTPFGTRFSASTRMILRNVERQPVRSLLSALGVSLSVAILVVGMFMFGAVDQMMFLQFQVAQREDLAVSFQEVRPQSVRFDLRHVDGVESVELFRAVAARLVAGPREHTLALTGLEAGSRLRRIVSSDGAIHPIPAEGVVLSEFLAELLGVGPGDRVTARVLEGARPSRELLVAGVVDDFLGLGAWMDLDALHRVAGGGRVVSGAHLTVRADREAEVYRAIERFPAVAGVASPSTMVEALREQMDESILIAVTFMVGFASIIAVGIVYNGARIALSERGRELASLRVLGFTRREVSVLLLGEQGLITIAAIPLGWGIGYLLAAAMFAAFRQESYRIPMIVGSETYLWSAVVILLAAAVSGFIVRRRLDRLDLIAVLKTRE
jgi:putative ABC transport system permease protein